MKLNFSRLNLNGKDVFNLLIEINYLAIIFLVPLYFAYLFPTYNIFEFNKIILFKTLVWLLLLFTGLKFIFYWPANFLNYKNRKNVFLLFKKYLAFPLVFIIGLGLLLPFSINPWQSFFGSYDRQAGFLSYLFYFIWFFLLFINLISANKKINQQKIKRIIIMAVISGLIVALYGILQILNIDFIIWSESPFLYQRASSTFGQPNFLASYLLFAIPLSIYLFIKSKKSLIKFFYFLVFCILISALFFTASRGALVALGLVILGIIFFLYFKLRLDIFKKILISASCLILLFLGMLGFEYFSPGRISNLINLQYGSSAVRVTFYKVALAAVRQKPFLGYGQETGSEIFIKYYKPDWGIYGDVGATTDRAHNLILDILLIGGLSALILFALLYYQFFYLVKKNIKFEGLNSLSPFLSLGVIAYLLSLLFSFSIVTGEIYFFAYLAILSSINLSHNLSSNNYLLKSIGNFLSLNKPKRNRQNLFYCFSASFILVILVAYGLSLEKRTLFADYYFNKIYSVLAEKKYFAVLVLNNYLQAEKTNQINQDFYNQFLAAKFNDFYISIDDLSTKYIIKKELKKISLSFDQNSYKNILAQADLNGIQGDLINSQKYFTILKKITPFWPLLYLNESQVFSMNGKYQAAIDSYQIALANLPDNNDWRLENNNQEHRQNVLNYYYVFNRGIANNYLALKNYQSAEYFYQAAYRYNPNDFTLLKKIADTYYLRGDLNEAIKYNERGFVRSPRDYNWPLALASLYYEKNDKQIALEYLAAALKLAPDNLDLKNLRLEYIR